MRASGRQLWLSGQPWLVPMGPMAGATLPLAHSLDEAREGPFSPADLVCASGSSWDLPALCPSRKYYESALLKTGGPRAGSWLVRYVSVVVAS